MHYLKKINHTDIYFFGIVLLAISLPLSVFMMSFIQILLVINWLWEGDFRRKLKDICERKSLWIFLLIYLIHVLGLINTSWPDGFIGDYYNAIKDLRIKLPLLLLPVVIGTSAPLSIKQLKIFIVFFSAAVLINTLISTLVLLGLTPYEVNDIRDISIFISHIRFALLINTSIFSLVWLLFSNVITITKLEKIVIVAGLIWLVFFLFLLQSLTGIGILLICSFVFVGIWVRTIEKKVYKILLVSISVLIPLLSVLNIYSFINDYMKFDVFEKELLTETTPDGNYYWHDFNNLQVENKHWVGLYICNKELKEEWDKRSDFKFDEVDKKGQRIKYTIIRYLTSKGLRKDGESVRSLHQNDIDLIEAGYANWIFKDKNKLYTRLYQVIWEVDLYLRGGNPSGHSVAQRIEYLRASSTIISNNPFFGVGTGDVQLEFNKQYDIMESKLNKYSRHRAHNQFVTFIITFGFLGALVILFALFYPPFVERKYSDFLFIAFLLVAVVSMLNEDTLETQPGVTFFAFFYSLFIFGRRKL